MKILVIINARAKLASSEPGLKIIRRKFAGCLHSITVTACAREALNVVRGAGLDRSDTVAVVGGDGTVNSVLDALAGTGAALGVIPRGTANDLSTLHGLPVQLSTACDVILQRQVHAVDLVSINARTFVTAGGLGFVSAVAAQANKIKSHRRLGRMARVLLGSELYVFSAGLALLAQSWPRVHLTIQTDRGSINLDSQALMISNQAIVGRRFCLAPGAASDDGQFEVSVVENQRSRMELAAMLLHALHGAHGHSPSITTWRTRALQVRASEPLPFYADGEHLETQHQFAVGILPRSLNLIVPGDRAGASMGAIRQITKPRPCLR